MLRYFLDLSEFESAIHPQNLLDPLARGFNAPIFFELLSNFISTTNNQISVIYFTGCINDYRIHQLLTDFLLMLLSETVRIFLEVLQQSLNRFSVDVIPIGNI